MKQKIKLPVLQYKQRHRSDDQRDGGADTGGRDTDLSRLEEIYLAKNRMRNRGIPGATPTEALLEELRKLYGENSAQRDVFGRRTALPSEIAKALNNLRRK